METSVKYPSSMYHEKNEKFMHRHPIIPSMSIYNALRLMSINFRDANAVNCLDLTVKYQELINDAAMFSKAFRELGIKKGDIVSISLKNTYQAVAAFFAANSIGAVVTFLNSQSTTEQIINYLNEFESPLFIHNDKGTEYDIKIIRDTKAEHVITLKDEDISKRNFDTQINNGYNNLISFRELKSIADYKKGFSFNTSSGKENALILFTSGTTGLPKSVVITNKNILASGIYMKNSCKLEIQSGEKSLVCVPFSYPYGFCTSLIMSLLCGREAVLAPNLCNENIAYYYGKGIDIVFGSPAMLELTMQNIPKEQRLSTKTFISGGDFLYQKQIESGKNFFKEHGADIEICNGSGNAESTGASTNSVGIPYRIGTVGKILVGTHPIVIDSETGEELSYGQEGELCISGEHIFKEYFKNPELTNKTKFKYKNRNYIKTGMLGILDYDGYFKVTGRVSRFYINGDLNKVYLEKIQNIMLLISGIESCVAVPKPDDDNLYTTKAYVVLSPGIEPDDNFRNYLNEELLKPHIDSNGNTVQLKPFEIPTSIEFIEHLPRDEAKGSKIDISLLEEIARNEYEAEKEKAAKLNLRK